MLTAYPPTSRYSTPCEPSNFKNSLKSCGSVGIAIEGSAQDFQSPKALFHRPGQPPVERIIGISQGGDREVGAVDSEFIHRSILVLPGLWVSLIVDAHQVR